VWLDALARLVLPWGIGIGPLVLLYVCWEVVLAAGYTGLQMGPGINRYIKLKAIQ